MKRFLIITGVLLVVTVAALAALLISGSHNKSASPSPSSTTEVSPAASPTPKMTPHLTPVPNHDEGTVELSERFPVVRKLPHQNPYWEMAVGGEIKDNIIPLNATVFVLAKQDTKVVVNKQRPYIVQWLTSIGQAPGTYNLRINPLRTDGY